MIWNLFRIYLPADATHQALQAGILEFVYCNLYIVCNLEFVIWDLEFVVWFIDS